MFKIKSFQTTMGTPKVTSKTKTKISCNLTTPVQNNVVIIDEHNNVYNVCKSRNLRVLGQHGMESLTIPNNKIQDKDNVFLNHYHGCFLLETDEVCTCINRSFFSCKHTNNENENNKMKNGSITYYNSNHDDYHNNDYDNKIRTKDNYDIRISSLLSLLLDGNYNTDVDNVCQFNNHISIVDVNNFINIYDNDCHDRYIDHNGTCINNDGHNDGSVVDLSLFKIYNDNCHDYNVSNNKKNLH